MKNLILKNNFFRKIGFFAFVTIPLTNNGQWHELHFNKIKPNQVQYQEQSLQISVKQSASPLIYTFEKPLVITDFDVSAEVLGELPKIPKNKTQGQKNYDDFVLRFGLIMSGKKRLSWLQRLSAPHWLIEMEKLLPLNKGVKEILFFTTCQNQSLLNKTRHNNLSSLFIETCLLEIKKEGPLNLQKTLDPAKEVIGLWISTDGDETKASFELHIKKINLNYK